MTTTTTTQLADALRGFVELAEHRAAYLGGLSEEMGEKLLVGREALAAYDTQQAQPDEARKAMIDALVKDVETDANDNGAGVYLWYVREHFNNLALQDLAREYRDAGLDG